MGEEFRHVTKGIITGLTAKTTYKVWVTASTARKEGEKSNIATVETCKRLLNTSTYKYLLSNI